MAGRQAKRDESVCSGSRVGGLRGPSCNPSILLAILHCVLERAFKGPSGGCGPLGQDSFWGCVTLGGSWASLCRLLACRVPGPRSVLLTCWCLPVPPLPWLSSPTLVVSSACQPAQSGGWAAGAGVGFAVTSIHPSLAPGREWELVLQSGQAKVALTAAEPHGHYHLLLCDSRARLSLGIESEALSQNLPLGPPAPCPCWRCCEAWHCEVTLLFAKHPAKCPTPQPLVMLPFLGTERQGHLAKVIQQGHTHTHSLTLTHGDQEVRRTHLARLPDSLSLPLRQLVLPKQPGARVWQPRAEF